MWWCVCVNDTLVSVDKVTRGLFVRHLRWTEPPQKHVCVHVLRRTAEFYCPVLHPHAAYL
jgi:hypothetical protein